MADDQLPKMFHPETIRGALVRSGLFLAGWQLLKSEVQYRVRDFFCIEHDGTDWIVSESYKMKVLPRHKSVFEASLLWLVAQKALTREQADQVRTIKQHRDEIAHELPALLLDQDREVRIDLLTQMQDLISVLGRFWGRIEASINPDFDDVDVQDSAIVSGTDMVMSVLVAAASEPTT